MVEDQDFLQPFESNFYTRLAEVITRRYDSYVGKTLWDVYQLDDDFLRLEASQVEFTTANRERILLLLDDPELV